MKVIYLDFVKFLFFCWFCPHRIRMNAFMFLQCSLSTKNTTPNQARLSFHSPNRSFVRLLLQMNQSSIIILCAFQRLSTFNALLDWILSTGYWFNSLRSEVKVVLLRWKLITFAPSSWSSQKLILRTKSSKILAFLCSTPQIYDQRRQNE